RLWWTQFQLSKLCKQSQTRLLFSPIPETPLAIGQPRRYRAVVTCHDLIPLRFPAMFGSIKAYYRYYVPQVLGRAERVICNSEATAGDIAEFYGLPASKLVPIPLAYDASHFRPVALKPELPDHDDPTALPYFLMVGRQVPYKNMAPAIAALSALPNHRLLIAGPTDYRYTPELAAMAEELGVRSRLKFLSYVPYHQLPALISHAVALVFPSLWEGFGIPVLEAMACGAPVITSKVASLPEVAGDAAYYINDPTDFKEIAGAMRAVAHDSQIRQQLSKAGLQRARQFSWQKTGQATVEVLRQYL
ncbi:MAG: glycosyltransferase family 1 protein, partial [Phormidesmis sp.]